MNFNGEKIEFFHTNKLRYSEKAKKFCEISTLLLSYVVSASQKVEISQNIVAFSEYMNFKLQICYLLISTYDMIFFSVCRLKKKS